MEFRITRAIYKGRRRPIISCLRFDKKTTPSIDSKAYWSKDDSHWYDLFCHRETVNNTCQEIGFTWLNCGFTCLTKEEGDIGNPEGATEYTLELRGASKEEIERTLNELVSPR